MSKNFNRVLLWYFRIPNKILNKIIISFNNETAYLIFGLLRLPLITNYFDLRLNAPFRNINEKTT